MTPLSRENFYFITSYMDDVFIALNSKEYQTNYRKLFVKDPLLLLVLIDAYNRSRKHKEVSPIGLQQRQFVMSKTEAYKYRLQQTQAGRIMRKLKKLCELGLIKKTDSKTMTRGATIFQFLPNNLVKVWGIENN